MAWCLVKSEADNFKKALKDGTIDPIKLAGMTSAERNKFFATIVSKDNASQINALFESKLLLKNQQAGMITWAKRVAGLSQQAKRDLISRIERMDTILDPKGQFLNDLANQRLGIGVTQEEAKNIATLSKAVSDAKTKMNPDFTFKSENDRLAYGWATLNLENYINELKLSNKPSGVGRTALKVVREVPGTLKSIVASLDNSFFGRQGIKTLYTNPVTWSKAFLKSWVDMGKELAGKDAMGAIKADIYSRPNAINGKYNAGGYGLNVLSEEAYPSSLPEKIPLLGRLFKASESAYNGAALRIRADLADKYIKLAEENGLNMLNPDDARGVGNLISSLTGRGSIGKLEPVSKELNVLMFSVKFLKSNFDTLTAHIFDRRANTFARKEAAKNLLRIVASVASILSIAKVLDPNSVDQDPRSTNFGKVKIWGHWVDMTGGMASIVTLASRIIPTSHNGDWGFWYKSSGGNYTKSGTKYGGLTALDIVENFFEGKLSPVAGLFRDAWKGKDFSGKPITLKSEAHQLLTPISVQTFQDLMKNPDSTNVVGSLILDGLGFSTSTFMQETDWSSSTAKKYNQFRTKVGDKKFQEANDIFNRQYAIWLSSVTSTEDYKNLTDDEKSKLRSDGKLKIEESVFKQYGFEYKQEKKTLQQKARDKQVDKLLP